MSTVQLYHGDCLDILPTLADGSVDAVICDLPYGTTACSWDLVIPLGPLWEQYLRVCKPNAAIAIFASQPFTTDLIQSNRKLFRYAWVWDKNLSGGFLNANRMPLKVTEDIVIFYQKQPTYNPQMTRRGALRWKGGSSGDGDGSNTMGKFGKKRSYNNEYLPTNLIEFTNGDRTNEDNGLHPTQKPLSLLRYLVMTYTNRDDVVLDNTMGSGTTGVACVNLGRNFIGIEKDPAYFEIARKRIEAAQQQGILLQV